MEINEVTRSRAFLNNVFECPEFSPLLPLRFNIIGTVNSSFTVRVPRQIMQWSFLLTRDNVLTKNVHRYRLKFNIRISNEISNRYKIGPRH